MHSGAIAILSFEGLEFHVFPYITSIAPSRGEVAAGTQGFFTPGPGLAHPFTSSTDSKGCWSFRTARRLRGSAPAQYRRVEWDGVDCEKQRKGRSSRRVEEPSGTVRPSACPWAAFVNVPRSLTVPVVAHALVPGNKTQDSPLARLHILAAAITTAAAVFSLVASSAVADATATFSRTAIPVPSAFLTGALYGSRIAADGPPDPCISSKRGRSWR